MTRSLAVLVVVLAGCSGSTPEPKKGEAEALAEARAAAETKERAGGKLAVDAKAQEAKAREETKAAMVAAAEAEAAAGAGAAALAPVAAAAPVAAGSAPEPFENESGLYGYRTAAGEVSIPPSYAMAQPFEDQVAAVLGDVGWSFIDRSGKRLATAFVFDNAADYFVEGRARIVDGDKHGFVASTGEIVVPPTWSFAQPFSGGYAAVCEGCKREDGGEHFFMTGGTWGYVDAAGKLVIPPRFEEAGPFVDGRATVKEKGRELAIGPDGIEVR